MRLPVDLTGGASDELRDASRWYEERRAGLGLAFVAAVDRAIDQVARWPRTGAPIEGVGPDPEVRRMRIERFPYYAAYVVHEGRATIVAVAHERRRPRYWVDRLPLIGNVGRWLGGLW